MLESTLALLTSVYHIHIGIILDRNNNPWDFRSSSERGTHTKWFLVNFSCKFKGIILCHWVGQRTVCMYNYENENCDNKGCLFLHRCKMLFYCLHNKLFKNDVTHSISYFWCNYVHIQMYSKNYYALNYVLKICAGNLGMHNLIWNYKLWETLLLHFFVYEKNEMSIYMLLFQVDWLGLQHFIL